MSFLPMSLAYFTKTFGFDEDDTRLNLNTEANQKYEGFIAPHDAYGCETTSNDRYVDFGKCIWYEEQK